MFVKQVFLLSVLSMVVSCWQVIICNIHERRCLCSLVQVTKKGPAAIGNLIQVFFKRLESLGLENKQVPVILILEHSILMVYAFSFTPTSPLDLTHSGPIRIQTLIGLRGFILKMPTIAPHSVEHNFIPRLY